MREKHWDLFKVFCMAALLFGCMACDNELEVQQSYPFAVETMPVPAKIAKGDKVEIRCELKREGRYEDAEYTIRYFQYEGRGSLQLDGVTLLPNDRYPLKEEKFRLYYVSASTEQQSIEVVFEDGLGRSVTLSFDFNNETKEES